MEMPQIFENKEFGKVRVTEYNGAPWFVASDVAKALGYERPADAVNIHCKKANKITQYCDSPDRVKTPPINLNIIPESDVYRLVMRSNLPGAERFQDWVVEEVLPAIRKHGGYLTPTQLEEALLNPDVLIRLATQLKEEREARVQAEARVAILSHVRKTYTTWDAQCRGPEPFAVRAAYPVQAERNLRPVRRVCRAWLCPHQAGNPRKRQDRISSPMDAARKEMAPGHARLKKVPATRLGGDFFHMSNMNPKAPDP